jgi:hypothetical protein
MNLGKTSRNEIVEANLQAYTYIELTQESRNSTNSC